MKNNSVVIKAKACRLQARLTQPFRISLGQHNILDNILFSIELHDGTKGFGEAAVATHITGETVDGTLANLREAADALIGKDVSDYLRVAYRLAERLGRNPCALAALEMALLDALTRQWKMPLWRFFGTKPKRLKTDMTVVLGNADEAETLARAIHRRGIRTFKVKIGHSIEEDFKRLQRIHKVVKPCPIYLDANQAFSAQTALRFLKRLKQAGISPEVIEQPVAKDDWEGLAKVTRDSDVTVLADESVATLADAVRVIREKAADAINIKLMKFGILQSREIAQIAHAAGLRLMIGCMMETSLATTAAAHLASVLQGFDYVDLDTPFFIRDSVMKNPCLSQKGVYDLRCVKNGIGVLPDSRARLSGMSAK